MSLNFPRIGLLNVAILLVLIAGIGCSKGGSKSDESTINRHDLNEDQLRIPGVLQRASFEDIEGNTVQISDYEGKVLLIDFWETWCSPCLMVFPALDSLRAEYGDRFEVMVSEA